MAKKKEESTKIILERTYVIPLRSETLKVPPYKKAEKASKAIRQFITKHMKPNEVKIGPYLNLKVWEHGMRNPPGKIKVIASKDDKGKVSVELEGAPKPKIEEKKEDKKAGEKPAKKAEPTAIEAEAKEIKGEKAEESKKVEKEEIKEMQKEHSQKHAPKQVQKHKEQIIHPVAPKHE